MVKNIEFRFKQSKFKFQPYHYGCVDYVTWDELFILSEPVSSSVNGNNHTDFIELL